MFKYISASKLFELLIQKINDFSGDGWNLINIVSVIIYAADHITAPRILVILKFIPIGH